jgi:hypothetical protein
MKLEQAHITIRLHCSDFPGRNFDGKTDIKVGPQKGDEVVDDVFGDAKQADFRFDLRVERPSRGITSSGGSERRVNPLRGGTLALSRCEIPHVRGPRNHLNFLQLYAVPAHVAWARERPPRLARAAERAR